ncbi:hypothetical protein [Catenuloplanes japonicus]|uniref:hypothetical protein n=1 Tax=Catenuloplanes japonicus TaxID=33876 RepID=UPI000AB47834|nr:hypothetical protein [Catenuloplanes japonicus]
MRSPAVNTDSRLHLWRHIRAYAVPPTMISSAAARRRAGDWAGACAASRVDVDLDLRSIARAHGTAVEAALQADLRHLAPDLLRWHLPRIAPDGLLRPALTIGLACYGPVPVTAGGSPRGPWLVARTAPAWADAGQRITLSLWPDAAESRHPHPRPDPRYRLDLHRHLWDTRHAPDLRERVAARPSPQLPDPSGPAVAGDAPAQIGDPVRGARWHSDPHTWSETGDSAGGVRWESDPRTSAASGEPVRAPEPPEQPAIGDPVLLRRLRERGCAVDRWADEAAILLRASGRASGSVVIRPGAREHLVLRLAEDGSPRLVAGDGRGLPVLPDAAVWEPPDLALLRAGLIAPGSLHPLVAAALVPGRRATDPAADHQEEPPGVRIVRCRGADHRIALVDGVLRPLDHDADQIRREETLAALTGMPLPCVQAIDDLHRRPAHLDDVRARLDHGDIDGALDSLEAMLGPAAVLRDGPLRDELEAAVQQREVYELYRTGAGSRFGLPDPARQEAPRYDPFAHAGLEPRRERGRNKRWSRYRRP